KVINFLHRYPYSKLTEGKNSSNFNFWTKTQKAPAMRGFLRWKNGQVHQTCNTKKKGMPLPAKNIYLTFKFPVNKFTVVSRLKSVKTDSGQNF
ncbi:hypothetical protein, partial [Chroococcus sp. FPU101]|uniref:hypothetical protein n=1 Tax=Chroococcus sp. FPU101 TaxID=1974212 RepID=UPI001A8E713E